MVGSMQQVIEKILFEYQLFNHTRFLAQMTFNDPVSLTRSITSYSIDVDQFFSYAASMFVLVDLANFGLTNKGIMKAGKPKDWYGRRLTPFSNILSILLTIAFAVCLALASTHEIRIERLTS